MSEEEIQDQPQKPIVKSGNSSKQQQQAYQEQWDETKSEIVQQLELLSEIYANKQKEYQDMQSDPNVWNITPIPERSNLLGMVLQAGEDVKAKIAELAEAWTSFLSVNPTAQGSVQF